MGSDIILLDDSSCLYRAIRQGFSRRTMMILPTMNISLWNMMTTLAGNGIPWQWWFLMFGAERCCCALVCGRLSRRLSSVAGALCISCSRAFKRGALPPLCTIPPQRNCRQAGLLTISTELTVGSSADRKGSPPPFAHAPPS